MNGYQIALVAYLAISALASIYIVGKPREPLTAGGAVVAVLCYAALIWAVLKT